MVITEKRKWNLEGKKEGWDQSLHAITKKDF